MLTSVQFEPYRLLLVYWNKPFGVIIAAGEQIPNANVITIERCKEILKTEDFRLTNEQVMELREYLYFLAGLQIEDEKVKEGLALCVE